MTGDKSMPADQARIVEVLPEGLGAPHQAAARPDTSHAV